MIRRTLIVPLVALILAAACSLSATASADSGGDLARIAGAGQALTKAGSAKFSGTVDIASTSAPSARTVNLTSTRDRAVGAQSSTSGKVSLTGAFDFKHRNGRFTIDASALGASKRLAKVQFLLVNGVAYFSLDSLKQLTTRKLPHSLSGKRWLRVDSKAFGASATQLNQAENPSSSLDALRGVTSDVQNLGPATVGGAATTHYRIHLDLAKAVQSAPPAQRAQIQSSIDALGGSGILPADLWIDRQGRPRKIALSFTVKTAMTSVSGSESFEYSDFGAAVSITAPPASQVADFSQLFPPPGGSRA
jgi:hypothetical protein